MSRSIHICHATYTDDMCRKRCDTVGLFSCDRNLTQAKKEFRKRTLHMKRSMKFIVRTLLLDVVY